MQVIRADDLLDELAEMLCDARGETFAGLDSATRDERRREVEKIAEWVERDEMHEGCIPAEGSFDEVDVDEAALEGAHQGFEQAKRRLIDGITKLVDATMVEAEAVVEIIPRIREMELDEDALAEEAPVDKPVY